MDFPEASFLSAIQAANDCPDLVVPLSFWREGVVAIDSYRNIQAFFNFYFVLEGLYGDGEYRKEKILPNFLKATALTSAVEEIIKAGFHHPFRHDYPTIESILESTNRKSTPADILELLIIYRGKVHHWLDASRPAGTPLTDHEYESIAILAHDITQKALLTEITSRLKPPSSSVT
jgi:hypothetical protein